MKQTNLKYLMIGVLTIASISCMDKERDLSWERRHMPKEAYFDFNMTQAVALDINYCFKSENYRVLFDIYDQDPIEYSADGSVSQKDIEPIYRAVYRRRRQIQRRDEYSGGPLGSMVIIGLFSHRISS